MSAWWAVPLFLLAGGFCAWVYYRREFEVPSRAPLLAARLVAVAGVAAILWNPVIPTGPGRTGPERYVVLDASRSMAALAADGRPLWDEAVEAARAHEAAGARILAAGGSVIPVDGAALDELAPDGPASAMAGAVGIAAEAGAREVVLVTDRRLSDPVATALAARRLGVGLTVDTLAAAGANVGLARLSLPAAALGGEAVTGRVEIEGTTGEDSVTVVIEVDGELVQALRVPAPAGGGSRSADFSLGGTLGAGEHQVTARIETEDAFARDDERTAVIEVDPEETGVLLVSFSPDWEPRFLLPVLDQVTGLPVRGFLRTGPDSYSAMASPDGGLAGAGGADGEAGGVEGAPPVVDAATMERLLGRAEMVAAMGLDEAAAEMVERAAAGVRRLLLFPVDGAGAAVGGVAAGVARGGEWYLDDPPPSPIAGGIERFSGAGLPPLTHVLPLSGEAPGSALSLRLGGAGEAETGLILRQDGGRRVAVVLASGFWRWAFRGGEARDHYRRLWASVGGWMLADEPLALGPRIRPERRVLQEGAPAPWLAAADRSGAVAITVLDGAGAVVVDSVVAVPPDGRFSLPGLPAGAYSYRARPTASTDPGQGGEAAGEGAAARPDGEPPPDARAVPDTVSGSFRVEAFTDEMLRLPTPAAALTAPVRAGAEAGAGSRPLRTWPGLYLLVLAAVLAEWIGRRRAGLR